MSNRTFPLLLATLLSAGLMVSGCLKDEQSVYNPDYYPGVAPTITSIAPPSNGIAGVTVVTITGTGFSPIAAENTVYYDATPAIILTASATQLTVRSPNTVKDSLKIRVAVYKVDNLSNIAYFSLAAAAPDFGSLSGSDHPWGLAVDATNNVYASLHDSSVIRITPAGVKTSYSLRTAGAHFNAIKFGPGGILYGVRVNNAIYRIPAAPGAITPSINIGAGNKAQDLDFDTSGNIWACGNNANVFRVRTSPVNVKTFASPGALRTVRVFVSGGQQYVYFGGYVLPDSAEMVIRYPYYAAGDTLGPREVVFNYNASSFYAAGAAIYAITFASSGEMMVSTDSPNAVLFIPPGGSPSAFYSGVLAPTFASFAWGQGPTMYASFGSATGGAVQQTSNIKAINTLMAGGAPYYGLK